MRVLSAADSLRTLRPADQQLAEPRPSPSPQPKKVLANSAALRACLPRRSGPPGARDCTPLPPMGQRGGEASRGLSLPANSNRNNSRKPAFLAQKSRGTGARNTRGHRGAWEGPMAPTGRQPGTSAGVTRVMTVTLFRDGGRLERIGAQAARVGVSTGRTPHRRAAPSGARHQNARAGHGAPILSASVSPRLRCQGPQRAAPPHHGVPEGAAPDALPCLHSENPCHRVTVSPAA